MKNFLTILLSLAVFNCIQADPIQFKDCGSPGAKINYFDVSNCKTLPCNLKKNTNETLTLSFTTLSNFNSLNNAVYGIIAGVKIPFPLPDPSACNKGVSCPVKQGNTYIQNLTLPVLSLYPSISLFVVHQLNDEQSNQVMCAEFPVKIS